MGKGLAAAILAALVAARADAQPIELKYGNWVTPASPLHEQVWTPWLNAVNAASGGTVEIRWYQGTALGNQQTIYGNVVSGLADIGYVIPTTVRAKFRTMSVSSLPFVTEGGSSAQASAALWRLYEMGLIDGFDEVKPLAVIQLPPGYLHTTVPVRNLDDLQGKKIQSGSQAPYIKSLGAVPVPLQLGEVYEGLRRGVVEGAIYAMGSVLPFKINEVTQYTLAVPFGGGQAMIVISAKKLAALPDAAKIALARHSGQDLARKAGNWFDQLDKQAENQLSKQGRTVVIPNGTELARWRERAKPVIDEWLNATPNGHTLLSAFSAELAKETAANR